MLSINVFFFCILDFFILYDVLLKHYLILYERKKKETKQTINLFLLPNNFQILLERFFDFVLSMLFDIIGKEDKSILFLYTLIIFILVFNLID